MESELKLPSIYSPPNQLKNSSSSKNLSIKSISQKKLSEVKKSRKQVEQDAQLLANRIALLNQEQLRTLKKIEETKKKAKEIYDLKMKNEEKLKQKEELKRARSKAPEPLEVRKQKEEEKHMIIEQQRKKKLDKALEIKKLSEQNARRLQEQKEQQMRINHQKQISVKEEIKEAGNRINQYKQQKLEFFRQGYQSKLQEEQKAKELKEREILTLERLEMELIKKLQDTQNIQKEAYEQLENALVLNTKEYESKYLKDSQKLLSKEESSLQQLPNTHRNQSELIQSNQQQQYLNQNELDESKEISHKIEENTVNNNKKI